MNPPNSGAHPLTGSHVGDGLRESKERVLSLWEARVRQEIPAAAQEPHPILINTLPAILDQLAEALSPDHPRRTATQGSTLAAEHGGERARLTHFRLDDIVAEYRLLRQVLFDVLEEEGPLRVEDRDTLNTSLDVAIMQACAGYAVVQSSLRDQLFAIMAHDLRNPLGVAQTAADLILLRPTAEDVPRWAARIADSIGRVDGMVQDLLDVMRVQSGARLQLELEECDLVDVVRKTVEHLRVEIGDRLVLEAPEPVRGHFACDSVRRTVENLASNAVKYGSPHDPITVTVRGSHGRAIIKVHNHGSYIPPEKRENLFRAFHRAAEAEAGGNRGWGLGLTQARAVAESHGGSIGVDSLPGAGTAFTIDIPIDARPYQQTPVTPVGLMP